MDTRKRIIETAFLAFIEYGYDRVSLNKIVAKTGLTKGAFYHNFASKSELLHEIMSIYFFSYLEESVTVAIEGDISFKDKIIGIYEQILNVDIRLEAFPDIRVRQEDYSRLLQECMNMDDTLMEMSQRQQESLMEIMTRAIDYAKTLGEIRQDIDTRHLSDLLDASIRGTIMTMSNVPKEVTKNRLQQNINTLLALMEA